MIQGWENSQCFHSMQATASGIEPYFIQVVKSKKFQKNVFHNLPFWDSNQGPFHAQKLLVVPNDTFTRKI